MAEGEGGVEVKKEQEDNFREIFIRDLFVVKPPSFWETLGREVKIIFYGGFAFLSFCLARFEWQQLKRRIL